MHDAQRLSPAITADVVPTDALPGIVEPRGLTLADLLAGVGGLSFALAAMPADVRRLLDPAVWDVDRLPLPQSRLLLVYLLGSWLVVAMGSAVGAAIAWRCARYRRLPAAGEWLAVLLVLVSPLVRVERLVDGAVSRLHRYFDPFASALGWSQGEYSDSLANGLIVGGITICLLGASLLTALRRSPPLFKAAWMTALAAVYVALSGRYFAPPGHNEYQIPLWNAESWREFEFLTLRVPNEPASWFLVAVPIGLVLRRLFSQGRTWGRWTEWIGVVMLLGTAALYAVVLRHPDVGLPGWKWLLAALAIGMSTAWPIDWCRRRRWRRGNEGPWQGNQA